jgi:hypothetical protein
MFVFIRFSVREQNEVIKYRFEIDPNLLFEQIASLSCLERQLEKSSPPMNAKHILDQKSKYFSERQILDILLTVMIPIVDNQAMNWIMSSLF